MDSAGLSHARFDDGFERDFERLLAWRRDVRRFRSDALPEGTIAQLVTLASLSPSVGYSQPTRYVRVSDPRRRAEIVAEFERSNAIASAGYDAEVRASYAKLKLAGLREAPEHLAVFVDGETARGAGLGRQSMPEMLAYSTVIAVHTFWLAARIRGIGVGWVSIFEPDVVARILDVPQSWKLVAYLCIGYPQEEHLDRELARAKWEQSDPAAATILER
jgi:5,6-dimethylbenzimidazole synthase